jgi:hypothetical protein
MIIDGALQGMLYRKLMMPIENELIAAIDQFLTNKDHKLSLWFSSYAVEHKENRWELSNKQADPISILLVHKNAERYTKGDDDIILASLSRSLSIPIAFLKSFICGWNGENNSGTSISGHLLGDKLRKKYIGRNY